MVEWKNLVAVSDVLYGYPFESSLFTEESAYMPLIRIRDVKPAKASTYYTGKFNETYRIKKGDILVGMDGEFNLGKWNDRDGLLNQRVLKLKGKNGCCLDGYLFHYMGPLFKKIEKETAGGSVKHLSAKVINTITIPIPSLEEQTRIVGILDTFTSAIDNLKEQIAQRRKQYEYYRDQLLDPEGKEGVEMKTLGEVCIIGDGLHGTPVYDENGDYYFINGNNLFNGRIIIKPDTKRVNEEMFAKYGIELDTTTILMSINGTIGNIAFYNNERLVLGKSAAYFKITNKDVIDNMYLYYLLQTTKSFDYYASMLTGSTIKNLGLKALRTYAVPIPSLDKQKRIVSILYTFEASIQNLEAQLKEREKQYEYYRNKLLTFE